MYEKGHDVVLYFALFAANFTLNSRLKFGWCPAALIFLSDISVRCQLFTKAKYRLGHIRQHTQTNFI